MQYPGWNLGTEKGEWQNLRIRESHMDRLKTIDDEWTLVSVIVY